MGGFFYSKSIFGESGVTLLLENQPSAFRYVNDGFYYDMQATNRYVKRKLIGPSSFVRARLLDRNEGIFYTKTIRNPQRRTEKGDVPMPKIYCPYCGAEIDDTALYCQYCGKAVSSPGTNANSAQTPPPQGQYSAPYTYTYNQQSYQQPYPGYQSPGYQPPYPAPGVPPYGQAGPMVPPGYQPRNRLAAGLLAILIGCLGVHNFYLGFTGRAIAQLLMTILSCGILAIVSQIWAIVEGIQILTGHTLCDARGVPLVT